MPVSLKYRTSLNDTPAESRSCLYSRLSNQRGRGEYRSQETDGGLLELLRYKPLFCFRMTNQASTNQASVSPPSLSTIQSPPTTQLARIQFASSGLPQRDRCAGVPGQRQNDVEAEQKNTRSRRCPPSPAKNNRALKILKLFLPLRRHPPHDPPPPRTPIPPRRPTPHLTSRSGKHRRSPPPPEPDAGVGRPVVRGPRLRPLGPVVRPAVVGLAPGVRRRHGGRQQGGGALGRSRRRRHRRRRGAGQRGKVQGTAGKVSLRWAYCLLASAALARRPRNDVSRGGCGTRVCVSCGCLCVCVACHYWARGVVRRDAEKHAATAVDVVNSAFTGPLLPFGEEGAVGSHGLIEQVEACRWKLETCSTC